LKGIIIIGIYYSVSIPATTPEFLQYPIEVLTDLPGKPFLSVKNLISFEFPAGSFGGMLYPLYTCVIFVIFLTIRISIIRNIPNSFKSILQVILMTSFLFLPILITGQLFGSKMIELICGGVYIIITISYITVNTTKFSSKKNNIFAPIYLLKYLSIVAIVSVSSIIIDSISDAKHFSLRFNAQDIEDQDESIYQNFRNFSSNDGLFNETLMSVESENHAYPQKLMFTEFSEYDGVNFINNQRYFSSSPRFDFVNYKQDEYEISIEYFPFQWLPLPKNAIDIKFLNNNAYNNEQNLYLSKSSKTVILDRFNSGKIENKKSFKYTVNFSTLSESPEINSKISELKAKVNNMMKYSYLSRSVINPRNLSSLNSQKDTWLPNQEYVFSPSSEGYNIAHIEDEVFKKLDNQHDFIGCDISNINSPCGFLVGDEELFVTAAYLYAKDYGLNANVVAGANIPDDGIVRGKDVTLWLEVQDIDGTWKSIDVTPRIDNHLPLEESEAKPQEFFTKIHRNLNLAFSQVVSSAQQNKGVKSDEMRQNNDGGSDHDINYNIILKNIFIFVFCPCLIGSLFLIHRKRRYIQQIRMLDEPDLRIRSINIWKLTCRLIDKNFHKKTVSNESRNEYCSGLPQDINVQLKSMCNYVDYMVYSTRNDNRVKYVDKIKMGYYNLELTINEQKKYKRKVKK
jgi:hypothetical protein